MVGARRRRPPRRTLPSSLLLTYTMRSPPPCALALLMARLRALGRAPSWYLQRGAAGCMDVTAGGSACPWRLRLQAQGTHSDMLNPGAIFTLPSVAARSVAPSKGCSTWAWQPAGARRADHVGGAGASHIVPPRRRQAAVGSTAASIGMCMPHNALTARRGGAHVVPAC